MRSFIITNEEIAKAELDIFERGSCFNPQQKDFIKYLHSCYVQAYAGTGKTSAIVGKLHVLAQKNVWNGGRGVCVLSHTNVAINEIKKHVAKHYPAIMLYPNFVGTIQEFVNKYVFIPYLASKGLRIKYQNEQRYFNYKKCLPNNIVERINKHLSSKIAHSPDPSRAEEDFFTKLYTLHYVGNKLCAKTLGGETVGCEKLNIGTKAVSQIEIERVLGDLVLKMRADGYFLFMESFYGASEYLKQNVILTEIIKHRFQFVFLDEAQDCSDIQLELLNGLFLNNPNVMFQQIGDINQAISETAWSAGSPCLYLGQSMRFGQKIAESINMFQTDAGVGVAGCSRSTEKLIIIYNSGNERNVLAKFAEILKAKNVPFDSGNGYFAISRKHKQLVYYFPEYSERIAKNRNDLSRFASDIEFIDLITKEAILVRGTNIVSKTLLRLLYKHYDGKFSDLREHIKSRGKINDLQKLVVGISQDVLSNNGVSDLEGLQRKLNEIIGDNRISFMHRRAVERVASSQNKYVGSNSVEINVGTIHSVKGQTHNATLLFSNKEHSKQDIQHALNNAPKYASRYKKLIYVAASRAKNIFVLAIEKTAYASISDKHCFIDFEEVVI